MKYNLPKILPNIDNGLIDVYRYYFWGSELTQVGLIIHIRRRDLKYTYDEIDLTKTKWKWTE